MCKILALLCCCYCLDSLITYLKNLGGAYILQYAAVVPKQFAFFFAFFAKVEYFAVYERVYVHRHQALLSAWL